MVLSLNWVNPPPSLYWAHLFAMIVLSGREPPGTGRSDPRAPLWAFDNFFRVNFWSRKQEIPYPPPRIPNKPPRMMTFVVWNPETTPVFDTCIIR